MAQRGLFTRLQHDVHTDAERYLASRNLGHMLERYEVPGPQAYKALRDLYMMNINYATMFPDFRGAAMEANLAGLRSLLGAT